MGVNDRYELGGKIMFIALVIFVAVVVFTAVLHIYARCYLLRTRRRSRTLNRLAQILSYIDDNHAANRGLKPAVIGSLPVFEYSSKGRTEPVECAVCLSEFEENEKGRILPKCKHCFHIECIDMWFDSHSTCPICRSPVKVDEPVTGMRAEEIT